MNDWVTPFLLSRMDQRTENISEDEYRRKIAIPIFACRRLASLFKLYFSNERLEYLLGSVLANLPQAIFDDLWKIDPLFILVDYLAAVQRLNAQPFQLPVVVIFSKSLLDLPDSCACGCIAHELAHAHLRHYDPATFENIYGYEHKREEEADDLCRSWGFSAEIENIRNYLLTKGGI